MRFGFKIIGILLLAAFWLPQGGVHRDSLDAGPLQTQPAPTAEVPRLSKARQASSPVQFHALRLGELKNSFGRNPEPSGPTELLAGLAPKSSFAALGKIPSFQTGLERTWQFYHRTALPVRAPCRAWEG